MGDWEVVVSQHLEVVVDSDWPYADEPHQHYWTWEVAAGDQTLLYGATSIADELKVIQQLVEDHNEVERLRRDSYVRKVVEHG